MKNFLKSIMIHFNYHFLIKSKKTSKNCLTKALLGHHYHLHYLICAQHLKHSCPEPAAPGRILAPHVRIWFWSGVCQIQAGPSLVQEVDQPVGPPWLQTTPARGSCVPGDSLPIASTNAVCNHVSPVIRRVTVNYFCLGQKRKDIFTERQG